ncbi:DEAD/DEAH box helicase [Methylacidiphilum caldifontis]|nr:DEAD/DEAH box helicase [Methylacidiphilum caldifontis]
MYGSAGVEATDADTLRTKEIVVSTPEKLDFALRNHPTIIDDVGLIVLDEGHMLGPGEREVRYEALVQRLLRRDDAGNRRIVCMSALFPETEKMTDLVAWIRRDRPGEPVHSEWRPTRQRFGWIQWEGRAARLQVRVEEEESYVPRFVEAKPPPSGLMRRNTFPQNKNELTLATAWQFTGHGKDVMIYCARRDSVESLGKLILKCRRQGVLSRLGDVTPRIREVIATGKEWLGPNHPAVRCLEYGVAIHHGGLPRQFLSEVERLLQSGDCRVTIASPTLAQGLNLSASVLLVPSIWRTQGEKISPVKFANVAGRAGRAFVDLEELVLHVVWERNQRKRRWVNQQWEELVAQARASEIESGLLRLTALLFERIARAADVSIEEVIEYVTGHGEAWDYSELVGERTEVSESEWERDVASLDAAILGLLDIETAIDELERQLDVVLDGSLFTRQIARQEARIQNLIRRFLAARARLIWSRTTTAQRRGYQVAGLGLQGGRFLDEHMEELVGALLAAETMINGNDETSAADAIVQFAGMVFQTVPFRPTKMPDAWRDALKAWISGRSAAEVVDIGGEEGVDFLQDAVMYRLAWAMEAVRVHATTIGHDGADNIRGLAAMAVEAGSANLSVITLLRSGLNSRDMAKAAVESTDANFVDRMGMLGWLESDEVQARSGQEDWLTPEGRSTWLRFIETIRQGNRVRWRRSRQTVYVDWLDPASPPEPGSHVIVDTTTDPQGGGWVLQLDFTPLGRLRSPLESSREDIVEACVGQLPGTVRIEYFGPRGVR